MIRLMEYMAFFMTHFQMDGGEYLVNKMLVKNGVNPIKVSQLTRLTLVDKEGLGGLNYVPSSSKDVSLEGKNYDDLYTLCKEILEDKENINFDKLEAHTL